jgi:hypothetical protein
VYWGWAFKARYGAVIGADRLEFEAQGAKLLNNPGDPERREILALDKSFAQGVKSPCDTLRN